MKFVFAALLTAFLLLQYRLWASDEGIREVWHLRQAVENQVAENKVLAERNLQMKAEVNDLKHGYTALEERARNDLGMIEANETFYQVVDSTHRSPEAEPAVPDSLPRIAAASHSQVTHDPRSPLRPRWCAHADGRGPHTRGGSFCARYRGGRDRWAGSGLHGTRATRTSGWSRAPCPNPSTMIDAGF